MQRSLQQHVKRARLAQCLRFLAVCFLWLAAVSVSRNARADALVNGGFDSGLSGWQTQGGVFPSMGVAVLADDSFTSGLLWQPVASLDGRFTLTFDFNNALSASVPQGALADSFFATLYFTDNLATFDIAGGMFDQAISLFDLDATGLANVTGSIGPSSKGANWSLFTLTFDNTHGFIVPAFDLRDLNLVNDDSAVALDNVKLTEIPEITQSPQDTVVRAGNDAMFTAAASSSRPLTFQWRRDGVDIPGATLPSLTLESLMPSDGGLITVVVSDGANNVESAPARLAVLRLERVARQDEDAVIDFQSVAGVSYAIEFTTNLVSNVWTPLFNGLGGTGNVLSVVSPEQGTRATLFYRLRIGNVVSAPAGLLRVKVRKRGKFPLALPFEEKAEEYGRITSSGAAMLMDTLAVWTPGQWSLAPHTARIITGAAVGRHFPITANTATQLTLEAAGEDLSAILAPGDRYEIAPLPTFASTFGADGGAFKSAASRLKADLVQFWDGKRFIPFFHNGATWRMKGSAISQNDTVLPPERGLLLLRRVSRNLKLDFSGQVAVSSRATSFPGPAVTFAANRFPAKLTLLDSGLGALPDWNNAKDKVRVWNLVRRKFETFSFNGVLWRKFGTKKNANGTGIAPGTAFFVKRKNAVAGIDALRVQPPPFSIDP
jgi:hypothetical protein